MEFRKLGLSGLKVPVLCLGTATFGGKGDFFKAWGETGVEEATRMVDLCLEHGVNFFDTADIYSQGVSEEVLGKAIQGKRDKVIIATKAAFQMGDGPNDLGSSRYHLIKACEGSLKRLGVETIDLYQMHGFDGLTPVEETLRALDDLVRAGKVRYIGCSNYSGWHLMKSIGVSEKMHLERYISYQAYYSLLGREYEWELMPLAVDQNVGTLVWSPLGWGRLTGKIDRNTPNPPKVSRLHETDKKGPPVDKNLWFDIVDELKKIGQELGKSVPQVALNWLLQRPTVSSIIIGARTEEQLRENLGACGWNLEKEHVDRLDLVSERQSIYPYWHQKDFGERLPFPT